MSNQKEKRMPNKDGTWPQLEIILPGSFIDLNCIILFYIIHLILLKYHSSFIKFTATRRLGETRKQRRFDILIKTK